MKIKDLLEKYGENFEIKISFYACANTFELGLSELPVAKVDYENSVVVFNGEFN